MTRIEGLSWRAIGRRNSDHPLLPALLLGAVLIATTLASQLLPDAVAGRAAYVVAVVMLGAAYLAWPKPALLCFALLMLFARSLARWIAPEMAQLDEIVMPVLVVLALARTRPWRRGLIRPVRDGALVVALGAGVASALIAGVPTSVWLLGLLLLGKVFAFLYIVEWHDFGERDLRQLAPTVLAVALGALVVGALEVIDPPTVRQVLNLGTVGSPRGGLPSIKSVLTHPGVFSWFATFIALFLFAAYTVYRRWWMLIGAVAFSAATVLSARRRALVGLGAAVLAGFTASTQPLGGVSRALRRWALAVTASLVLAVVFLPALVSIAQSTFEETADAGTARVALVTASIQIARDNFPLGAGLGRFGSAPSKNPYSPVYSQYGLDDVEGLTPEAPRFVKDAFWARILGETGALGMAALVTFVAATALSLWRAARRSYSSRLVTTFALGTWMVFTAGLVDTLASSMFDSPPRVYLLFGAAGAALSLARGELELARAHPATDRPGGR